MTLLLGSLAAFLVIAIILFPDQAFAASLRGLTIWWKIVFPALLPFLILSEMLIGFGVVQALGTLLEPLMQVLFRIPGVGGWALAMGSTVGFPSGAKVTAALRKQGLLSRVEAERLLALSHVSSPVFIVTIVGVGFLQNAELGMVLAAVHFAAAAAVGVVLRFRSGKMALREEESAINPERAPFGPFPAPDDKRRPLLQRAVAAMQEAFLRDGRAFGKLLGDAVTVSVQTLMIIGGYMIIFSVIVQIIDISKAVSLLQSAVTLLSGEQDVGQTLRSAISGILEIHLGSYAFGQSSELPAVSQMAAIGAILGWGGLSSHAQVKSITQDARLRYLPFLMARLLHALFSFVLTFLLWNPLNRIFGRIEPSFLQSAPQQALQPSRGIVLPLYGEILLELAWLLLAMLFVSLVMYVFRLRYRVK
jgi:sporulation integral membrane protein YlbJ